MIDIQVADGVMLLAPIEQDEIEKILDEHSEKIESIDGEVKKHTEQIFELQKTTAVTNQRLNNIEQGLGRLENYYLQGNTLLLQGQQNMVVEFSKLSASVLQIKLEEKKNDTELEITKNENKSKIIDRLLILIGTIAGFIYGKSQ